MLVLTGTGTLSAYRFGDSRFKARRMLLLVGIVGTNGSDALDVSVNVYKRAGCLGCWCT